MPNGGSDPLQDAINRLLRDQAEGIQGDPLTAAIAKIQQEDPVGTGRGFFARAFDALTPETREEFGLITAGVAAPIIQGAQAVAEIPGLFTSRDLSTDRAARFLERFSEGILSRSEDAALRAGVSPELIADSHLLGELFGYVAPVVASFKAARLITGIKGAGTTLARNFLLDTTAGAIFGGVLSPGENIESRTRELLTQSAIFGVSGIAINGLVFAAKGIQLNRSRLKAGNSELEDILRRIQNGEQVVVREAEALPLVHLMNEEGFLASSSAAQDFMRNLEFDNALIAGVRGASEAGHTRGFIQDFGSSFTEIEARMGAIRAQFPNLKFDVLGRSAGKRRTFDLHFGFKGLNNHQKAQIKREGRYTGQIISKGGSTYEYVRPSKKAGSLVVKNADGKVTTIKEKGVTNLPYAVEEIPLPPTGAALYEDFREFTNVRMVEAMGVEGALSEETIIAGFRDGTLRFSGDRVRQLEIGGAITHPQELGLPDFEDVLSLSAEEFVEAFMKKGKYAGDLLEPVPIRSMDDVFDAWVEARGLDIAAKDIEAFRANFAQRYRSDLWDRLPAEDLAIFQSIREETLALAEEGSTLELRAGVKGLFVETLPDGRVALRDINTGARVEYGSAAIADDVVDNVIRSEKDPFGLFLSDGPHGMPGYTTGFGSTDGVFSFANDITYKDFLPHTPTTGIRNRRDYFDNVERLTGVPLFSQGFGPIDAASSAAALRFEPVGRKIDAAWKGLERPERIAVAEFWTAIEGSGLKGTALVRAAREAGLNNKQIRAFTTSRKLYELAAQELGLPESRIIPLYYSRIRPALEEGKTFEQIKALLSDDPRAVVEWEFWALKQRTGELANVELDPVIVMNKHFRSLYRELEVAPHERQMDQMLNMKIKDLPRVKQKEILSRGLPKTTKDSFVLPDDIRAVGKEYMLNIQGQYGPGFASSRRFMTRIFQRLGMKGDPKIFDQLINTYLSMQYGAALGLRFATMNRNAMQNMWTMYPRVGGKFGGESLKITMTQEGYNAAAAAGAVRPVTASVSMGDAVFANFLGDTTITGNNPASQAAAAAVRRALRLGRITRKTAEKFLIPYGSGDQVNRAWAYHWQRLHTDDVFKKFDAGRISWDKFLQDGLPFFSSAIKDDFRRIFDRKGREAALQYIGKQAADEAHFIYGTSASPGWMQKPFGRLLGVFGQWPLWLSELYFRRTAHATPTQRIQFTVRSLSMVGMMANMGYQTGINIWSWIAPTSLGFTGGPSTDVIVDFRNIVNAPLDQKAASFQRMAETVGSLVVPGQLFYNEIGDVLDARDMQQAGLRLLLGRPVDHINFAYDLSRRPEDPAPQDQSLSGLPSIDELLGRP